MLRDVLLSLAEAELYRPFWSGEILEELRRNLGPAGGVAPERVDRVISTMRAAFPGAMVDASPERDVAAFSNDPGDRHVLAAAVEAGARIIVTHNIRHFKAQHLEPHAIEALTPDDFLLRLLLGRPANFIAVIRDISAGLLRPALTPAEVLMALSNTAPRFSKAAMEALHPL